MIFYARASRRPTGAPPRRSSTPTAATRRWVYLHYFKEGQPSINWLDPSFAGMRLVIGDALHSLADLGSGALRLDANGFLGVEKSAEGMPAWSEGHPLSEAANHLIASMVRKVGGFTFQELNLTIDDIRATSEAGADLSYDFVTRPALPPRPGHRRHRVPPAHPAHLRWSLGVDPASLVHALQNHDELTYELVHWATGHATTSSPPRRRRSPGPTSPTRCASDLRQHLTGRAPPTTWCSPPTGSPAPPPPSSPPRSGSPTWTTIDEADMRRIRQAHLLLAMYNALQPGVFALSGWDLCGMLTLPPDEVSALLEQGDTRWIHRGAHDLMGINPTGPAARRPACRAGAASTARCPSSWRTRPASPASCRPSWPSASGTGSR